MTKEEKKEYNRQYYEKHKQEIFLKRKEYLHDYYLENKEKLSEYMNQWREEHKEEMTEYNKQHLKEYRKTPMGRAVVLCGNYKRHDKNSNRGECTLTAQWIVDNIFPNTCHYCGKKGWEIMGCDRINNDLPHTPDNVVPCCLSCNDKKGTKTYEDYIKMINEAC